MVKKTTTILIIISILLLLNACKRSFTLEELVKIAKIDVPENTELMRYKVGYTFFRKSQVFMHIKISEKGIEGFVSPYINNKSLIRARGISETEGFFLDWCKLDEDELDYLYIFMDDYLSPKSKSAGIVEIIFIQKPQDGYHDVYIYKNIRYDPN